ncbi:hypothetical protein KC220_20675, partial [Mycobacterium tuberculosis]|nr:hypothetical protein [Mycobacterium tuberculosis]
LRSAQVPPRAVGGRPDDSRSDERIRRQGAGFRNRVIAVPVDERLRKGGTWPVGADPCSS